MKLIVARSFARIHETNLKKQGIVPLTFADPADYDRIGEDDRLGTKGLADLAPGQPVTVTVTTPEGETWTASRATTPSPTTRSAGSRPARRWP